MIVKFGLSMLTWIERIRIGIPPMICGTVSETRADLGGLRIDMEGDPDDDDAVVVGAGQGRGDRDDAQRRALERPGQVHPADRVEGMFARARRRRWSVPTWLEAGQLGLASSRGPVFCAAAGDARPPGSRQMPRRLPVNPGGILKLRSPEELVAVVAVEFQR